jgi:hypothetical protein
MKIIVIDFVNDFKTKKIQNTKINEHAISDYLRDKLEIRSYLPFREKRAIAEMVVEQNIEFVDGIKRYDNINSYLSFVVATLTAYTNLEFNNSDPVADYDLLAESGLLPFIIAEFKSEYDEIDVLLKMAIAAELEDNNINTLVGKFLNGILDRLDSVGEVLKNSIGDIDIKEILGENFKQEDLAKLKGFLDKYNK